jgi:tetratricopeptide (TPR) repeat protein
MMKLMLAGRHLAYSLPALMALLCAPGLTGATTPRALTLTTTSSAARDSLRQAVRALENGAFGASVQAPAQAALAADPDFAFAHYFLGVTSFPASQAEPHLERARTLLPKASDGERRYIEAALLNRAQKSDEAIAALRHLLRDYPDERMAHMLLGQILANVKGDVTGARASLESARRLDANTVRVHVLLGNLALVEERYAAARQHYGRALRNAPEGSAPGGAHYGLALARLYEGDVDGALARLTSFLTEYRKSRASEDFPEVFIWNSLARIKLEHGRLAAALADYERGFESVPRSRLEPRDQTVWRGRLLHGRARTLARMGRHEEAWQQAEQVKALIDAGGAAGAEYLPAYHYLAGYLKLEAGQTEAARTHLEQADKTNDFHRLLLARAYERSGDQASARKLYQQIVDSKVSTLERALAYAEAKRKLRG